MSSSVNPVTYVQAATPTSHRKTPSHFSQAAEQTPPRQPDTVQLSTTARVASMKARGASVIQIASLLNMSETQVESDLGITAGTSTSSNAAVLAALSAKH